MERVVKSERTGVEDGRRAMRPGMKLWMDGWSWMHGGCVKQQSRQQTADSQFFGAWTCTVGAPQQPPPHRSATGLFARTRPHYGRSVSLTASLG